MHRRPLVRVIKSELPRCEGPFVRHMISDDLGTPKENAGGVVFSEPHAAYFADMNGDGIPDFIVGKRFWSHNADYLDPFSHLALSPNETACRSDSHLGSTFRQRNESQSPLSASWPGRR